MSDEELKTLDKTKDLTFSSKNFTFPPYKDWVSIWGKGAKDDIPPKYSIINVFRVDIAIFFKGRRRRRRECYEKRNISWIKKEYLEMKNMVEKLKNSIEELKEKAESIS